MEQGEALDSVLALYPAMAAQLRPLLETAMRARSAGPEELPTASLARQRARGLALAADLRGGENHAWISRRFWRPVVTVLAVIAILVMSTNSLWLASAHSIPGDTLYPLKRSVESTQLRLVSNPAKKLELENMFNQRRVEETKSLIHDERLESVDFTGVVSSQSDAEWVVSGIPVKITSRTEIDKGIQVGSEVEVSGSTNSTGGVDAVRLSLVEDPEDDSTLPVMSPTQTGSSEDDYPEESPTSESLTEDGRTELSPTQTLSPELDNPESSPAQTTSPEDGHLESTPTQISSPEGDHPDSTPTQTISPEGDHSEGSPTPTPTPQYSTQESSPTRSPTQAGSD